MDMKLRSHEIGDRERLWYADFVRTPMGSSIEVRSFHGEDFVILEDCTPPYEFPVPVEAERVLRLPDHLIPDLRNFGFVEGVCFTLEVSYRTGEGKYEEIRTANLRDLRSLKIKEKLIFIKPVLYRRLGKEEFSEGKVLEMMFVSMKLYSMLETLFFLSDALSPYVPIESKEELLEYHEGLLCQALEDREYEEAKKHLEVFYRGASFEACVEKFKADCINHLHREEDGSLYSLCLSLFTGAMRAMEKLKLGRVKRKAYRHVWMDLSFGSPNSEEVKELSRRLGKFWADVDVDEEIRRLRG